MATRTYLWMADPGISIDISSMDSKTRADFRGPAPHRTRALAAATPPQALTLVYSARLQPWRCRGPARVCATENVSSANGGVWSVTQSFDVCQAEQPSTFLLAGCFDLPPVARLACLAVAAFRPAFPQPCAPNEARKRETRCGEHEEHEEHESPDDAARRSWSLSTPPSTPRRRTPQRAGASALAALE
jgi:hypothetical protein